MIYGAILKRNWLDPGWQVYQVVTFPSAETAEWYARGFSKAVGELLSPDNRFVYEGQIPSTLGDGVVAKVLDTFARAREVNREHSRD